MKRNNKITEVNANKFFDELHEDFTRPVIPQLELMARQTIKSLSNHFNLGELGIDKYSIKKLETFFQNSERQLSEITKLLFTNSVGIVFGQILCNAYGGEWGMAENPVTAREEVTVFFLDGSVQFKVFPFSLVSKFFFNGMHEFKMSDMIETIGGKLNSLPIKSLPTKKSNN